MHAEGIYPEVIGPFRVPRSNVPSSAFVEPELGKKAEGRGQAFFAVPAFFFDGCESWNWRNLENVSRCGGHTTPRANSVPELYNSAAWKRDTSRRSYGAQQAEDKAYR
jgi:hypothetical protein